MYSSSYTKNPPPLVETVMERGTVVTLASQEKCFKNHSLSLNPALTKKPLQERDNSTVDKQQESTKISQKIQVNPPVEQDTLKEAAIPACHMSMEEKLFSAMINCLIQFSSF